MAWRLLQAIFLVFESLWKVSMPAVARMLDVGEERSSPSLERALLLAAVLTGLMVVPLAGTARSLVPVALREPVERHDRRPAMGCAGTDPQRSALGRRDRLLLRDQPARAPPARGDRALCRVVRRLHPAASFHWVPRRSASVCVAAALTDLLVLGVPLQRASGVAVLKVTLVPIVAVAVGSALGALVSDHLGPNVGGLIVGARMRRSRVRRA